MTYGRGARSLVGEERGADAGVGGERSWAAVHCAGWAEGKTRGGKELGLWAKTRGEGPFLFLFSFKTNLFQNIFKTKFEFLFNL